MQEELEETLDIGIQLLIIQACKIPARILHNVGAVFIYMESENSQLR